MTSDNRPAEVWTTPAAEARKAHLRITRIKRDIKSGKLRAYDFGTEKRPNYRIRVSDWEEYLASLAVVPAPPRAVRRERRDSAIPKYV